MATRNYRVRVVSDGRELEAEGDRAFVLQMLKLYGPGGTGPKGKGGVDKPAPEELVLPAPGKPLAIREFIQRLDLKRHTDISLAFGFYLERFQGVQDFTSADINKCYYEAKLETSNTSQMIVQNVKRGFLMPAKASGTGRSRYLLTRSGEQFIESKLPSND